MNENPFPGMNPWLESHWGDVHTRLTTYACDLLQLQLPAGLRARIEEYVAVECDDELSRVRFAPDVRIIERPGVRSSSEPGGSALAVAEPILVPRQIEPETLHTLYIVDTQSGQRIVTSIEFLSLANKSGEDGRTQYLSKQTKLLLGDVNIVEIDLLRAGAWVLAVPRESVPKECQEPYRISVIRASNRSMAEMYQASFRAPLPVVRIPLRPTDNDVELRLQTLIDMAYVNGRYAEDINYANDPEPALKDGDANWVDRHLREIRLR